MNAEAKGTAYYVKAKAGAGLDRLVPLVAPFGATAQSGNSKQSLFIESPQALPTEVKQGLETQGFVITGAI